MTLPPCYQKLACTDGFSGTVEECLLDFSEAHQNLDDRRLFASFLNVPLPTVNSWYTLRMPRGDYMIKLMFALKDLGYDVTTLNALDPYVCKFGQCIAHGKLTIDEAAKLLDYNEQQLYRIFRGSGMSEQRMAAIKEYVGSVSDTEPTATLESQPFGTMTIQMPPPVPQPEVPESAGGLEVDRESAIELLASLLKFALPLAAKMSSDEFTAEERDHLRELAGSFTVFHLKNALVRLQGERVRTLANGGKP